MKHTLHRSFITFSSLLALGVVVGQVPAMAQLQQANPSAFAPPTMDVNPQAPRLEGPLYKETEKPLIDVPAQPSIVQVDRDVFQVNRIEVHGNAIIADADMRRLVSVYEGREVTADDLATLVARINEEYRSRGYLTSLAFVPPQDLERGVITVKVLEGVIGDMEVSGNKYFKAKVIEKRIAEKPGDPLNIPKLEKELLRINRQEPFRVKATLAPGDQTGETKIKLEVQEQQPFQIALTSDNMGRPGIGTYRTGIELSDRNVTGHGDRANVRYLIGAGQHLASASYTMPLGSKGTELSALFGFNRVDVDLEVRNQPELIGNYFNYGVMLSHPLDIDRNWVVDLSLNSRHAAAYFDGEREARDEVRAATLGMNYNRYDRWGRTFARVQTTGAPDILGASTGFVKAESFFTRVTRLPKNNILIMRSYTQWSPNDLPPIEQFQLGGANTVRGYTEGLLLGDRGYSMSAEWRWPVPLLAKVSPWAGDRIRGALFFDFGQVWMDKKNRYYSSKRPSTLASGGFGLRAHLTDYMQGYADLAFGLADRGDVEPNAQPTARIHFGVRSELLPNDYKSRSDVVTPIKTNVFRPRSVGVIHEGEVQPDVADPTLDVMDQVMNPFKVY